MKHYYLQQLSHWLIAVWILGSLLPVQAQTAQPPVQQWQYTLPGNDFSLTATVQAVKASTRGYGLLAGNTLVLLSKTGQPDWTTVVPGSFADSSTSRVAIQKTLALTPTQDGGFVVLAQDITNRYYATKVDSTGHSAWTKTLARPDVGSGGMASQTTLAATPDGGFLVVGSYIDALSYLTLTKLSAEGYIVGQWRVKFSDSLPLTMPLIHRILFVPHQGYLLVGQAASRGKTDGQGVAMQVDEQYNLVWQKNYAGLTAIQDVVANPGAGGSYIAVGSGAGMSSQAITIAQAGDGTVLASLPGSVSVVSLVTGGSGTVTVLDAAPGNNGDFRLTNGSFPAAFHWTKTFGGSGKDVPTDLLATDDGGYLVVGTTTSTDGDVVGKSSGSVAPWVLKVGSSAQVTTLRLLPPTYDCQTGFIRFQTSGGDGSLITYTAPGVTRMNLTDNFGTVEQALRTDPKVITIQASQSGQTVSYDFDLGTYCRTGPPTASSATTDTLKLIAPTYNCQTGAITFHTVGGDGSPVEYAAAGVTDWTTNPNQFVEPNLLIGNDVQPLILRARQHGQEISFVFNIKAACGRARRGIVDSEGGFRVSLLGNPAHETAVVEISGAEAQSLVLQLFDTRGRLIEHRIVEQAGPSERQTFDIHQQATGTFLLHTTLNGQTRTVKFLKQ